MRQAVICGARGLRQAEASFDRSRGRSSYGSLGAVSKGETARQEPGMFDGVLEVVAGHHRASVRPIKCGDDVIRFVFHPTE
jgi:hypothetical protein